MNKKLTATLLVLLVFAMLLTACGPQQPVQTEKPADDTKKTDVTETPQREEVTLRFFFGYNPGLAPKNWWTEILRKDLGIRLDYIAEDTEMATMIATHELPDLLYINKPVYLKELIDADMLICLEDHLDKIPNAINNNTDEFIQFKREMFPDKKIYAIPDGTTDKVDSVGSFEYGMRVHIPYFNEYVEEKGLPTLNKLRDFLPILKYMQDKHPVNADGQSAYAFGFFGGWSQPTPGAFMLEAMTSMFITPCVFIEINSEDMSYKPIWADDSRLKEVVDFVFEANQMGILDPDMYNMTFADWLTKLASERLLSYPTYSPSDKDPYHVIPFKETKAEDFTFPWKIGNSGGNSGLYLGKPGKNLDRALEFVNYMTDPDNYLMMALGPKGVGWDVNDKGEPYLTPTFRKWQEGDTSADLEGGSNPFKTTFMHASSQGTTNWRPLFRVTHPALGGAFIDPNTWPLQEGQTKTETQLIYEDLMHRMFGAEIDPRHPLTATMLYNQKGFYAKPTNYLLQGPEVFGEEIASKIRALPDKKLINQAVLAKNAEERDSLWKEWSELMQNTAKQEGLTPDLIFELYKKEYDKVNAYFK